MSNLTLDGSQAKFDRSDTKAVKGVAVVLMLWHHLAGFSKRFPVGFAGFRAILLNAFYTALGRAIAYFKK